MVFVLLALNILFPIYICVCVCVCKNVFIIIIRVCGYQGQTMTGTAPTRFLAIISMNTRTVSGNVRRYITLVFGSILAELTHVSVDCVAKALVGTSFRVFQENQSFRVFQKEDRCPP